MMQRTRTFFALALASALSFAHAAEFDLAALEKMALTSSRTALAARDQLEAARYAAESARAFPNPELEYLSGSQRSRNGLGAVGDARSISLSQPLDLPWRRTPRIAAADAGFAVATAMAGGLEADLLANLRARYFNLLRREAELKNAREDVSTVEGVHTRIAKRVETGEAARFELIKADAELLNARKNMQAASFRVEQGRSQLRQVAGESLPTDFTLVGHLRDVPALPELPQLQREMQAHSPDLQRAQAEVSRAERQLELERSLRLPAVSLRAGLDEDPEVRTSRLGLQVTIPLWDQRRAQVDEAAAQLSRSRHELEGRRFSLRQELEVAYQQYEIALAQVAALESGILRQAEAALQVATAAYRFGERGFLEVLDAQRVFRAARAELIQARHELAAAWVEIERLRALSKENKR